MHPLSVVGGLDGIKPYQLPMLGSTLRLVVVRCS